MQKCLIALALFFVALSSQAQDMHQDDPGSALYSPPISPIPHWYEVRGGSWRVSLATIQELRLLIQGEIGNNKHFYPGGAVPRYAIQFRGETRDGHHVVRLVGACNAGDKFNWKLSDQFMQVHDGGKCYFEANYLLNDKQFSFRYHGYA